MALTELQRTICALIARQRRESGESYIAGGAAMSVVTGSPRISRDIDIFHDTTEAVAITAKADGETIAGAGFSVMIERARDGYVEAVVSDGNERVVIQWTADSAFRFFPLMEHDALGLTLHPFDVATNKVLALVGRLEPRDWVDVIHCHDRVQRLAYLAWAASGKDPGFSPAAILEQAGRSARYSREEIRGLAFVSQPPDPVELSRCWRRILSEATELIDMLPAGDVGRCVLDDNNQLFTGDADSLRRAIECGRLRFHPGRIRGAWPTFRPA